MFVVTGTPRSATGYASLLFSEMDIQCTHEVIFKPRACLHNVLQWYADGGERGESSWLAWAFLGALPGPVSVLHTTRNPWAVIDSLAFRNDLLPRAAKLDKGKQRFRDAIGWYCPRVMEYDADVDRAAAMVVDWNAKVEAAAALHECPYRRYRVEDIGPELVTDLLRWLDIDRDPDEITAAINDVPRNVNGGRRIEYGVEIKNPLVKAHLQETMPGVSHTIARVLSVDRKRGADELASMMTDPLADEVRRLAARYGYQE